MVVRLRESAEAEALRVERTIHAPDGLSRGHRGEPSGVSEIALHLRMPGKGGRRCRGKGRNGPDKNSQYFVGPSSPKWILAAWETLK